jgi:hypothetical protein
MSVGRRGYTYVIMNMNNNACVVYKRLLRFKWEATKAFNSFWAVVENESRGVIFYEGGLPLPTLNKLHLQSADPNKLVIQPAPSFTSCTKCACLLQCLVCPWGPSLATGHAR